MAKQTKKVAEEQETVDTAVTETFKKAEDMVNTVLSEEPDSSALLVDESAQKAKEEAESAQKAKEEAESAQKAKEAAEAAQKAKEEAEAAESAQKAKEEAEAAQKAKEEAEAAEAAQKAKEEAEAAEAAQKAKEEAEAAEAAQKAKEEAAVNDTPYGEWFAELNDLLKQKHYYSYLNCGRLLKQPITRENLVLFKKEFTAYGISSDVDVAVMKMLQVIPEQEVSE